MYICIYLETLFKLDRPAIVSAVIWITSRLIFWQITRVFTLRVQTNIAAFGHSSSRIDYYIRNVVCTIIYE